MENREPWVLYELKLRRLLLELDRGDEFDASHLLANGRANYILFENLIADVSGLLPNSQGGASDLCDHEERGYEVKSYKDPALHPSARNEYFQTSASSTFPANNHGPTIKHLLRDGDYDGALKICRETGFDKNDYYIYVNSAQFDMSIPLRYVVVPTSDVLDLLSKKDPRLISRQEILKRVRNTVSI